MVCPDGPTTLYGPDSPASTPDTRNAARSRTSMYCSGWSAGPGASVGPPRAIRFSHHGNRPTSSPGPRISPARATSTAAPNEDAAISPRSLSPAYPFSAGVVSGVSSVSTSIRRCQSYTDRVDTYV